MRHAWICVKFNILLRKSELVLEERNCSLTILVLDHRISISVRLEYLEVLRSGCSERSDLGSQRQPRRKSGNAGNRLRSGQTGQKRDGSTLAEASDDNAFAWDLGTVELLSCTVVLGFNELLDLFGGLEQASFIFGTGDVVQRKDCRNRTGTRIESERLLVSGAIGKLWERRGRWGYSNPQE